MQINHNIIMTSVTWIFAFQVNTCYLPVQCIYQFAICFGRYDHRNLIYDHTITWKGSPRRREGNPPVTGHVTESITSSFPSFGVLFVAMPRQPVEEAIAIPTQSRYRRNRDTDAVALRLFYCNAVLLDSRYQWPLLLTSQITRFMGPTWSPSGADRTQVGPMLASWSLLSGMF